MGIESSPYFSSVAKSDECQKLAADTFNDTWFTETKIQAQPSAECSSKMTEYFSSSNVNFTSSVPNFDPKWDQFPKSDVIMSRYGDEMWDTIYDSYNELSMFVSEIRSEFDKSFEDKNADDQDTYWETVDEIVNMQALDAQSWEEPDVEESINTDMEIEMKQETPHESTPQMGTKEALIDRNVQVRSPDREYVNGQNTAGPNQEINPSNPPMNISIPLKCLHCEKKFKTLAQGRPHLRMHSGFKPYKCQMLKCGYRSWNKNAVINNHFVGVHRRRGHESDVFIDLDAIGHMEGIVAKDCEMVMENHRIANGGHPSLPNCGVVNPVHAPLDDSSQAILPNEEVEEESEGEAYISPYFQNMIIDINGNEEVDEERKEQNNGSYDIDINRNRSMPGGEKHIAGKISILTGTSSVSKSYGNSAEINIHLDQETKFLYQPMETES